MKDVGDGLGVKNIFDLVLFNHAIILKTFLSMISTITQLFIKQKVLYIFFIDLKTTRQLKKMTQPLKHLLWI